MLRRLIHRARPRSFYDVLAAVGCFAALATGSAYAANTIGSSDIIDGEVKTADIGNGEVGSVDVKDNSINTFDVHSFIGEDVIDESLTGMDLKNGTVSSADLTAFSINENDIGSEVIDARHINNGTLNDEDVGQAAFVNIDANIGTVPGQTCIAKTLSGISAQGDHLLLTPDFNTSVSALIYSISSRPDAESAFIQVCNTLPIDIPDGNTRFNLLVFDAQ